MGNPTTRKPTTHSTTKIQSTTKGQSAAKGPTAAKSQPTTKSSTAAGAHDLEHRLLRASAALKKEFAKVQATMHKLRGEGTISFDALWELVDHVLASDPPLYLGGGYKTKEAFIAAELPGETPRSVQRNVLVARCFSPDEEAKHGIAFLEEVALYARDLTAAEAPPPAIHLDKLTLTLPGKNGASVRKKASAATIDDVRIARRALRTKAPKKTGNPVEKALQTALSGEKALAPVTVRTTRTHASFANVPIGELTAFARALGKAKVPAAGDD